VLAHKGIGVIGNSGIEELRNSRLQIEELKVSGVGCQVSVKKNKKAEI
jgi:hypothetical protein